MKLGTLKSLTVALLVTFSYFTSAVYAENPTAEYTLPVSPDNAAVLFIDNQTNLMLGVQSIDTVLLRNNTDGLAQLAKIF